MGTKYYLLWLLSVFKTNKPGVIDTFLSRMPKLTWVKAATVALQILLFHLLIKFILILIIRYTLFQNSQSMGRRKLSVSRKWLYKFVLFELWIYAQHMKCPWQLPLATWKAFLLPRALTFPKFLPPEQVCHLPLKPGFPQFQATFTSADLKNCVEILSWC